MRLFRVLFLIIFSLGLIFSLYSTAGYIYLGLKTPHLVGANTTYFTGMFIMALVFFVISLLLLVFVIVLSKKLKKK